VSPFLNSRTLFGSHRAKPSEWRDSQGRSSAFTEGPSQMETVTRRVRSKAEERACRRASHKPRSSDRTWTEWLWGDTRQNNAHPRFLTMPSNGKPEPCSLPDHRAKVRPSRPHSLVFRSVRPCSRAHSKGDGVFATSCSRRLLMLIRSDSGFRPQLMPRLP